MADRIEIREARPGLRWGKSFFGDLQIAPERPVVGFGRCKAANIATVKTEE
jgi:hypothetical protein